MTLVEIILLAINIVLLGVCTFYLNYCKKLSEVMTARDKSYEEEMGKIKATNEGVDNILKEMEHMKNAVSLEEARKDKMIQERNNRLLAILDYTEQINVYRAKLTVAIHNSSVMQLNRLVDDLSSIMHKLRSDVVFLTVLQIDGVNVEIVRNFGDKLFFIGNEMLIHAGNALRRAVFAESCEKVAMACLDKKEKEEWLLKAEDNYDKLRNMLPLEYKQDEGFLELQTNYRNYLAELYHSDIFLKYKTK